MSGAESFDRKLGHQVRQLLASVPGGVRAGQVASEALGPVFQLLVAGLIARPDGRRAGVEAALGATGASVVAHTLREGIGRPRPGGRPGGGFPSRHAAAAVAITRAVGRRHRGLGRGLAAATAIGLAGRVVDARHDPADIIAGAALGWWMDLVIENVSGGRR